MGTLPSIRHLKNLDDASRHHVLSHHADRLYREAAHAIAPRFSYGSRFVLHETAHELARARRSSRDRLRRLFERADYFGVDVGQPRVFPSSASVYHRYADNGFSTNTKFDFDEAFQSKIGALVVRDTTFVQRSGDLLRPEYFTNDAEASLVRVALDYYKTYKKVPDKSIVGRLLKEALDAKKIRKDLIEDIKTAFAGFLRTDISDREFVIDKVTDFAHRSFVWRRRG